MKTRRMLLLILAAVLLVCTAMMTTAYAITDDDVAGAEEIQTGDVLQVNELSEEDPKVCRFTPEEDGYYIFESDSEKSVDTFSADVNALCGGIKMGNEVLCSSSRRFHSIMAHHIENRLIAVVSDTRDNR